MNRPTIKTILLVNADLRQNALIESYLTLEGFRILPARNCEEMLLSVQKEKPDLIILDLGTIGPAGQESLKFCLCEHPIPVIRLIPQGAEGEASHSPDSDDCLTGTFRPRTLAAQIRAALRRLGQVKPQGKVLQAGDITLDRDNHYVRVRQQYVDLTPSEFDLLATLMSFPGRVFSRPELLDMIQGVCYQGKLRTVDIHVKNLRAKIETDSHSPHYIETVYGSGYRFTRG